MIPTLKTERLLLRPFCLTDFQRYAEYCADEEVMRYIGAGGPISGTDAWRQMAFFLGHWQLLGHGMWAVQLHESGELIGRAGFLEPEGWPGFELGWLLGREFWGHGFATEAAARALTFARDELHRESVISLIYPENAASIRVAERLGEQFEGRVEVRTIEAAVYGIHRDRWEAQALS